MKLDCLPLCSQMIKQKKKKNLTSIQSNMKLKKGVFLVGTQLLIRTLNSSRDLDFFISAETLCNSFRSIEDAVSMSYLSVHGMLRLR